ncbi:hypothetical protein NKR23_g11706 [Pleurostoma richardsiae]|uniref:Uncharacterized protein n=1 Tax=Pleurostoma richardsiae TaxID=41990 RepID=A0AA38RBB9_9PEZI|nr:hypothetical protein NKR23_g11706 [Pleurostoma richardsiae]
MPKTDEATDVASEVSRLSLQSSTKKTPPQPAKLKTKEIADSWEDEDVSSSSDEEAGTESRASTSAQEGTTAPPPTPLSPNYSPSRSFSPISSPVSQNVGQNTDVSGERRRPEKTDAVARRMIASALGVKVPKLTEEQRAYDKAIKEKERKRREEEKAAEKRKEVEAEKAKAAIWDD